MSDLFNSVQLPPTLEPKSQTSQQLEDLNPKVLKTPPLLNRFRNLPRPIKIVLAVLPTLAILLIVGLIFTHKKTDKTNTDFANQNISQADLDKISAKLSLGDPGSVLTVGSNSIFNGRVSVNKDLDLNGRINTNGPLVVGGLNVEGSQTVNQGQSVNGVSTLQGGLNVSKFINLSGNLTTTGNGTFSGDVTATNFIARNSFNSGNLTITGHLVTSGSSPAVAPYAADGGGASVRISGNDTTGTVTINTGSGPFAGQMATVTFRSPYPLPPRVILTPSNADAARLRVYVIKTSNFFNIISVDAPAANKEYDFDYMAAQ